MIEINFKFKGQDNIIKCNTSTYFNEICEEFAKKQSLDIQDLNIFYNDSKINLEIELLVSQQFGLENLNGNQDPTIIELLIFEEYPYQIKFNYAQNHKILKIKKSEKTKNVLERFCSEIGKDITKLFFLYGGDRIPQELYNTAIYDIMNNNDKNRKVMDILVNDNIIEDYDNSINSDKKEEKENIKPENVNIEESEINLKKNLLEKNGEIEELNEILVPLVEQSDEKHKFLLKIFILLIIQYSSILLFSFFGFFYKFNEILLMKFPIGYELTLVVGIYSIMSICFNELLQNYKKKIFMIIILIFYSIITIIFSFSLSNYLKPKYIIIGISLINLNILSLSINSLFFKKYTILFFGLISSIFSFIGLICFSTLWIKSLLPIIFISLFWIISIAYQICWFYFSMKYCKLDELFNSGIIYNNAIFLVIEKGFSFGIKCINIYIQHKINRSRYMKISVLKIFAILLVQHIIIIIFVWISFPLGWNEGIKNNVNITIFSVVLYMIIILLYLILIKWFRYSEKICYILQIIYIPTMIIIYCIVTVKKEYILGFLFIIFFGLLSITLFIFYTEKSHFLLLTVISLASNSIIIFTFHFLWFQDKKVLNYFSIIFSSINAGFCLSFYFLDKYLDNYLISILFLDTFHATFLFVLILSPLLLCMIVLKRDDMFFRGS